MVVQPPTPGWLDPIFIEIVDIFLSQIFSLIFIFKKFHQHVTEFF